MMGSMMQLGSYERSAVLLATAVHLGRTAHGDFARRLAVWCGVSEHDVIAITRGDVPADRRLAELIAIAWLLLDCRGRLSRQDVDDLESARIARHAVVDVAHMIRVRLAWPDEVPGETDGAWDAPATARVDRRRA